MLENNRQINDKKIIDKSHKTRYLTWKNPPKVGEIKPRTTPTSKISALYRGEVTTLNNGLQEVYMKVKP